MESEMERPTAWEEIGAKVPAAMGSQLTQRSDSSLATSNLPADLQPASLPEFIQALTPCLQLCAPVGMSLEDRDTWFDAAFMAIGHLPPDILCDAAQAAMRKADHPAKIVPAIMAEAEERIEKRRQASRYTALPSAPDHDQSDFDLWIASLATGGEIGDAPKRWIDIAVARNVIRRSPDGILTIRRTPHKDMAA